MPKQVRRLRRSVIGGKIRQQPPPYLSRPEGVGVAEKVGKSRKERLRRSSMQKKNTVLMLSISLVKMVSGRNCVRFMMPIGERRHIQRPR